MPGIYNLGSTQLNMMSYVDVEGSGTNNSKIIGTVMYYSTSFTELRMISIESGSGPYGRAIDMEYGGYNKVKDVSISVPSASVPAGYVGTGIRSFAPQGPLTIEDSTISDINYGYGFLSFTLGGNYLLDAAQLVINNSRISVTQGEAIINGAFTHVNINGLDVLSSGVVSSGIRNETGCDMVLKNSSIKAGLSLVWGAGNNKIANTQLDGSQPVTAKCINVYDANLDPFTCQ